MKDNINAYVRRVKELAEHVKGNEQATKKSLIEPLFTALGYDVTDPRECVPEHREDFGKTRSAKPVDYAFFRNGIPIFFVEAKEVSRKLGGYDEQLADYFAKCPSAKLGILTNGVHWRFFSDIDNENVMDKRPFVEWQVLGDEPPPWDFLALLQKSQHDTELVRTFAQRRREQNLLVDELARLLEPAPEFIKLAVANIETRNLTASVIEGWKPVLKAAIVEWAKQQRLSTAISAETVPPSTVGTKTVETTKAELDAFETVKRLLGSDRPVEYEDTVSYFKIHLPGKPSRAICRLVSFGEGNPSVWLSLAPEAIQPILPTCEISCPGPGWSRVGLADTRDLEQLGQVLAMAWDARNSALRGGDQAQSEA